MIESNFVLEKLYIDEKNNTKLYAILALVIIVI